MSQSAELIYKCTDYFDASDDHSLLWNDAALNIDWPLVGGEPLLSDKDKAGKPFAQAATYA
jgi:dTDP-4-dehydrorhamnose 3,5-epimerase